MEEQSALPLHSTTNSNTKTIVAEQEPINQKKLSFSIDSILDKQQQQQQQPLFNCSNFKIKRHHHHHSTPIGKMKRRKKRIKSICFSIEIKVIIIDH
jgi:hypothetical protein